MVKPQIMYELIEVGEHMMEKNVNAMDSPEGIVMRVQRDVYIVWH
jgi:anaerobic ribonucleoside-triphosphate reductase